MSLEQILLVVPLVAVTIAAIAANALMARRARRTIKALRNDVRDLEPAAEDAELLWSKECQISADWQRRFWEMHAVVERVLKQRDEWRDLYRAHIAEHLEGQALLEHKIVQMRMHLTRSVSTLNRLLVKHEGKKADLVRSPDDLDPIDSEPVGQAERYYERMKKLLMETAPAVFDALLRRDEIAKVASAITVEMKDVELDVVDDEPDIEVDEADDELNAEAAGEDLVGNETIRCKRCKALLVRLARGRHECAGFAGWTHATPAPGDGERITSDGSYLIHPGDDCVNAQYVLGPLEMTTKS